MIIGVPKEIKNNENRVAITAAGASNLVAEGHEVIIERGAGLGSGITDREYTKSGAEIISEVEEVFARADMIMKVKEPLPEEYDYFKPGQILFTYLHLAAEKELTKALMERDVTAIAYETVENKDGSLPLLTPMSEIAGRLAILEGANYLQSTKGRRGLLIGGVPGVNPAKVVVIGGGVVGINSAKMAVGLGADVTILDVDVEQLRYLDDIFQGQVKTLVSNSYNITKEVREADLVVGGVLIAGARAPYLVTEEMIMMMQDDSVIIDVAIDQGGCIEGTYPTTHDDPIYVKNGVIHYSVSNIPGAVAETATKSLVNVTIPYALEIANKGYKNAIQDNQALAKGVNVYDGKVTYQGVAEALDLDHYSLDELL
ncbi:MAG: alanine dehydrogenase [Halanaerobacter sp.]